MSGVPTGTTYEVKWSTNDYNVATVTASTTVKDTATVTAVGGGKTTITASVVVGNKVVATDTCSVTVSNPLEIRTVVNDRTLSSWNDAIELYPVFDGKEITSTNADLQWSHTSNNYFKYSNGSNNRYIVTPNDSSTTEQSATVTLTYEVNNVTYKTSTAVYLKFGTEISLSATVSSTYRFDETDDKGKASVEDQLLAAIPKSTDLYGVRFDTVTSSYGDLNIKRDSLILAEDVEDIVFTPTKNGEVKFGFTAYTYTTSSKDTTARSGVLTITVTDAAAGGDVTFYGSIGEEVYMDSAEFDDYWDSKYPGGVLDYVSFSGVSGGSLLDEDDKTAGGKSFYVSPTKTQLDLDEVHFKPNSTNAKKAVTISFNFTAYGENRNRSNVQAQGTVNIVYMSDSPSDIKYSVGTNNTVNLRASDFTAAYKEATGSNAPSNLTIVFQGVPRNGSLTYTDSSKKTASAVKLTSSNIRSRNFTTKSSGTNQIGDVTYTGSSSYTDTIEYVAYSGNTPKFKGSVVFGGAAVPEDVLVTFQSINGQAAQFSWSSFTLKSTALASAAKIRFTAPTSGTLYLNGVAFAATTELLVSQVNGVTYVPQAGSNNQEKLVFTATDATGKVVGSGTVVINVTGNAPTTPGGVTSASQFTDVKTGAWYYTYLDDLVRKGIVSGRDDGRYDPEGTVNYGEALKLVLGAAGVTQPVGTGNDWAINYKNYAVSKGWIGSDISLIAPISRTATAELIAHVLGLSPRTTDTPFADTTNGYVAALYYTNPQIFIGNTNPNGGKPLFKTNDALTRAEICTIIYRMNDYYLKNSAGSGSRPDGI